MTPAISHVLLDIEGTTCPVSFVSGTLFPYAARELGPFLARRHDDGEVRALVEAVLQGWQQDGDPQAQQLWAEARDLGLAPAAPDTGAAATGGSGASERNGALIVPYLRWLIAVDRKFTPLKELQGLVWREGYGRGELVGALFEEVPDTLRLWHRQGLVLAVYSSGSIAAQQLLYGHSQAGDLRPLFSHWFDTHSGGKHEMGSYQRICEAMDVDPGQVLFLSDSEAELEAAAAAGLQVVLSDRDAQVSGPVTPGQSNLGAGATTSPSCISTLSQLSLAPTSPGS